MTPRPIAALLAFSLALGACEAAASPGSPSPSVAAEDAALLRADVARAPANAGDAIAGAAAVNALGVDLYRSLAAANENLVFSPSSIALALAMARAGARGETAMQMDAVMRDAASDDNPGWLNALERALAGRTGQFTDDNQDVHELTLRIANAAFGQEQLGFETDYLEALAERFDTGVRLVDYANDPEAARRSINDWVNGQTAQRIPELLPAGMVTTTTRLTLVNAIYLKAPWRYPFYETAPGTFHRADGFAVEVPMMTMMAPFPHARGDGWQAVELPYAGGEMAMLVIVPDDLAAFEATLTPLLLDEIVTGLGGEKVEVSLPRFGIETRATLNDLLAELGMPDAFDPGLADFSGITREAALFISAVVHQANMDVDEKGTTAAAATAVLMELSGTSEPPIRVDRPFLFALRDVPTGAILFLGRIGDPSIGS
jgi:serpin B